MCGWDLAPLSSVDAVYGLMVDRLLHRDRSVSIGVVIVEVLTEVDAVAVVEALAAAKSRQDVAAAMRIDHADGVLESPPVGTR